MKNEIRKHLPLSVGLQASPTLILDELLERGVVPDSFTDLSSNPAHKEAGSRFRSQGASILAFDRNAEGDTINVDAQLEAFLHQQGWQLKNFIFESSTAQRAFDTRALSLMPQDDQLRRKWLQAAPRILKRERPHRRVLWLTGHEDQLLNPSTDHPH
jgi:hypothetical protein